MGAFLDSVKGKRRSPEAIAHRAALFLSDPRARAIIVESGDDWHFYDALLSREQTPHNISFFVAYGRDTAIAAIAVLLKMGKSRAYAIVDRDLHIDAPETLVDGHCLVISRYSFENFFADEDIMMKIGSNFFSLEEHSDEKAEWQRMVQNFRSDMDDILIKEHAFARDLLSRSKKCLLSDIKINSYVAIDGSGQLSRTRTIDDFVRETGNSIRLTETLGTAPTCCTLRRLGWTHYMRGHFFWTLFVKLINTFRTELDGKHKSLRQNRQRTRAEISERHALESATAFLSTPGCVRPFLEKIAKAA